MTVARAPHLRSAGVILTTASLVAIAFATLMPEPAIAVQSHFCLVCGSFGTVDVILNVILFVPLGIGLALSDATGKRAIIAMCALSALIETAQFFVIPGRDSTIGDVVTNTLGGALGFAIGRYAQVWLRPSPRIARFFAAGWAMIWLAIQVISSFGFAVMLPDSQYYGQIARALGKNLAVFPGRVLNASVGDVQIPNTALSDHGKVRQLLLDGATVFATVIPSGRTSEIAPIVRIADPKRNEIVLLAQKGEYLVFGVRTGAQMLRLRPSLFALPDAFPARDSIAAMSNDALRLSGQYAASGVTVSAESRPGGRDRHISVVASLGWTFWLPFQWFIEGTRAELALSWIWTASLMIPLAYWTFRINGSSWSQTVVEEWPPIFLGGAALLSAGLILVPHAFGLSAAPFRDWLATLAGVVVGAGLSAVSQLIGKRAFSDGKVGRA